MKLFEFSVRSRHMANESSRYSNTTCALLTAQHRLFCTFSDECGGVHGFTRKTRPQQQKRNRTATLFRPLPLSASLSTHFLSLSPLSYIHISFTPLENSLPPLLRGCAARRRADARRRLFERNTLSPW